MSYVNNFSTNLNGTNLFLDSNPYKIKLIGKIFCESIEKDNYQTLSLYFLECHEQKYILSENLNCDSLWGMTTKNINLEPVETYFEEIKLAKGHFKNVKYFTGQDKYLENKTVYSNVEFSFKEFVINADKDSPDFGIKDFEKFKELDYIDFTILLNAQDTVATDYVNQFFKNTPIKGIFASPRPAFILKDGTRLSIQASEFVYCNPRENNAEKYTEVEVGFPSKVFEELIPYAEDDTDPTQTVYGYVPVNLLNKIIEREGIEEEFYKMYFKAEYIIQK